MDFNDDFDIDTDRKAMKPGRRTKQGADLNMSPVDDNPMLNTIQAPVRTKRTGGWADDTIKLGKNKSTTNLIEQERFQEQKVDIDDDIPVIPDMDEVQEDGSTNVSQAPISVTNRVTTFKELDSDVIKRNTLSQFDDININHLTRFLYSETSIKEADVTWTKDSLFNELIGGSQDISSQ